MIFGYVSNFDTAFEYDKHTAAGVALIENDFTRSDPPLFPESGEPRNLRVRQRWKHLIDLLFGGFGHGEQGERGCTTWTYEKKFNTRSSGQMTNSRQRRRLEW